MSESDNESLLRTVTSTYGSRPSSEMNAFSLGYALGLAILFIPLLPFLFIIWIGTKLQERVAGVSAS